MMFKAHKSIQIFEEGQYRLRSKVWELAILIWGPFKAIIAKIM